MVDSLLNRYLIQEVFEEWAPGYDSPQELCDALSVSVVEGGLSVYLLDFAIANHLNDIVEHAVKHLKRSQLEKKVIDKRVTPLHVAVISKNQFAVELLVSRVNLNLVDKEGFSPLHHAALIGNRVALSFLERQPAIDLELKTARGATYREIIVLCRPQSCDPTERIPVLWRGEDGVLEEMNGELFTHYTGAEYSREIRLSPLMLAQEWLKKKRRVTPFKFVEEIVCTQYERFLRERPIHSIGPITHNASGIPLAKSIGLGLFATRAFYPGEIIGEFVGEMMEEMVDNNYIFMNLNAEKVRNETACINDGFNNVVVIQIAGRGLEKRYLFIASGLCCLIQTKI